MKYGNEWARGWADYYYSRGYRPSDLYNKARRDAYTDGYNYAEKYREKKDPR